jgi:hypothetical protein
VGSRLISRRDHHRVHRLHRRDAKPLKASTQLHITTIAPDGTGVTRLADIGSCICVGFQAGLTWSPDGTTLAVNAIFPPRPGGLYEINADGTRLRLLATGAEGPIGWQPLPVTE